MEKRVLVVEDDPRVLRLLLDLLASDGCKNAAHGRYRDDARH